jgi:hypothetical protein
MKLPVKNQDLYERLNDHQKSLISNKKKNIFGEMLEKLGRGEDIPEIQLDEKEAMEEMEKWQFEKYAQDLPQGELKDLIEKLVDFYGKKYGRLYR